MRKLDIFTQAYIACALWTSDTNGLGVSDIDPIALECIIADCERFQDAYSHLWHDDSLAGHDLWLTRNRHGSGFWDRPSSVYSDANATRLTQAAHEFGERSLYAGDDTKLYVSQG
jgi:hypothetical protein